MRTVTTVGADGEEKVPAEAGLTTEIEGIA